ncbi:MAG TPA: ATPase domain-containing protein [Fimbriimonadaceae bacterium]|nr:ATPase domain-containing protein [Fimbriimonadaceae bacterium]
MGSVGEVKRCATGIAGLDNILGSGFISNQMYLIEGAPGSGKTTLGLHFLREGVRLGEKCLYITLSETKAELEAGARSHGWDLKGIEFVELIPDEDSLEREAQVTMYHPEEVEIDSLTKSIMESAEKIKPDRVVFDSLSELKLLAQTNLRYRRQVLALKRYFISRGATILLLDDKSEESADIQLQSIAHGVLNLYQSLPPYGASRRRLNMAKFRGSHYRGGFHDFAIVTGGMEVFPRLVAAEHGKLNEHSLVSSGVSELDSLLGGGIERGTSTLLMGPAGTGKSTIGMCYSVAATKNGEHASAFLFDESVTLLQKRCRAVGLDFEVGDGPGQISLRTVDPAEVSPGEFASMVRHAVEVDNASIIFIDSLNGYLNAMPDEPFLTAQLHELLSYLGRLGVTTLMVVAQHGMVGALNTTSPIDTSYLADTVILHRYYEHRGMVKKAVSVVKKRAGLHEETIRGLTFNSSGVHVSEPLTQLRGVLSGIPVEVPEDLVKQG